MRRNRDGPAQKGKIHLKGGKNCVLHHLQTGRSHDNRDLEIIQTQNRIHHFLSDRFGDENGHMMLGSMSCEMLAKLIADTFGCTEVTVQEDGQGGGVYVRE